MALVVGVTLVVGVALVVGMALVLGVGVALGVGVGVVVFDPNSCNGFLSSDLLKVVYKNNDVRLELSRLAKQGDPKMKVKTSCSTNRCSSCGALRAVLRSG